MISRKFFFVNVFCCFACLLCRGAFPPSLSLSLNKTRIIMIN